MGLPKYISKFIPKRKKIPKQDVLFRSELSKLIGYEVRNIDLYCEAFSLRNSENKSNRNYERLEFLGDSVLGAIISFHLFTMYPDANEGFLTQMKSKIVNRKNLNKLGDELQLKNLIRNQPATMSENISGNLFEALIGAVYLDYDYEICKKIVLENIFTEEQINKMEHKIISYKSLLLEWSQKRKVCIRYETQEEMHAGRNFVFRAYVWIDEEKISNAAESSKKKAEEKAAQRAFYILNKKQSILEKPKAHT
ncbi:MAG: ribonuclease III [Bergeyella sp.]